MLVPLQPPILLLLDEIHKNSPLVEQVRGDDQPLRTAVRKTIIFLDHSVLSRNQPTEKVRKRITQ